MENEINIHLGKKIKTLRKRLNKSQNEMAALFNIEQQSYCKLENGKTSFSANIQEEIYEIFGLKPLEFLYSPLEEDDMVTKQDPNENYITNLIFNQFRLNLLELQLRNADLEIEVRKYRTNFIVGDDGPPIHVII